MKKIIFYMLLLLPGTLPQMANAEAVQPFLDLLVWKAAETNTSWATTLTFPDNATHVIQSNPDFNLQTGFRGGLSYSPCDNFWDAKIYWTYFSTNTTQKIPTQLQAVTSLFFSGSFFISENLFFGASAKWNILLNMLDLEISHAFKPIPSLSFTPRIGVKGATLNQTIKINWDAVLYTAKEKVTNNFAGIGPSFGLNARWNACGHFSLVSDISTALMYGRWNDSDVYQRPLTLFTTPTTISTNNMSQPKLGTVMLDYYLGLEWHHQGRSSVTVKLGYEMQYWPNQLRLLAVQQLPTFGDLTLQGATCGVSIDL